MAARHRPPRAPRAGASDLQPWLKEIETTIGLPEAEQLAIAERLLDWTTRNIQLDALPPMPKDPLATAGTAETLLPALRGELGPGYGHLPLEILLYGHGDAQERARIFILLCRQAGIDAVMLGFQSEQSTARRGWLPAVLWAASSICSTRRWGCRFLGRKGRESRRSTRSTRTRSFCEQLDVEGLPPYPVTESDLKQGVYGDDRCASRRRSRGGCSSCKRRCRPRRGWP